MTRRLPPRRVLPIRPEADHSFALDIPPQGAPVRVVVERHRAAIGHVEGGGLLLRCDDGAAVVVRVWVGGDEAPLTRLGPLGLLGGR